MKHVVIAPVSELMEDIYVGIKEIQTEKVILVCPKSRLNSAYKVKEELSKFHIPVSIRRIDGYSWLDFLSAVSELKFIEKRKQLMINISTGDRTSRYAMAVAAFINGIKAFTIEEKSVMMLPVIELDYSSLIGNKKLELLRYIYSREPVSIEDITNGLNMSAPLASYHINGPTGLKRLGLIEVLKDKKLSLKLTDKAKIMLDNQK